MRKTKVYKRAFSLVELVSVILIIGVLATAIFVGGGTQLRNARVDRARSDLHNFQIAAESTLNENGFVANIENNSLTSGQLMRRIADKLNDNLPVGYKLGDTTISVPENDSSNIRVSLDQADTGNYVIFESEKTDPWSNPYYVIMDCGNRVIGTSDFYITVASAGPNGITEIGGYVESDDIFLISQSVDHKVTSAVYEASANTLFSNTYDGQIVALSTPKLGDTSLDDTSRLKYTTSSGSTNSQAPTATTYQQATDSYIAERIERCPFAYAYISDDGLTMYFDRAASESDIPAGAYTGIEAATWSGISDVPWCVDKKTATVKTVVLNDYIKPVKTQGWFDNSEGAFANLTKIENAQRFDMSENQSMSAMFRRCGKIERISTATWDTSNVTNMSNLFFGCSSLSSVDMSGWDTSKVTSMASMFSACSSLTTLDVSNFDTSNVKAMAYMFWNCTKLTELDLSNFDTSNITSFYYMFQGCIGLKKLNVSGFDTRKVTNMQQMFWRCENLKTLDVSSFDTSRVTNMHGMFQYCANLTQILASSSFVVDSVSDDLLMFGNCYKLVGGNETTYNSSNVSKSYAHIDVDGNPGYFTEAVLQNNEPMSPVIQMPRSEAKALVRRYFV